MFALIMGLAATMQGNSYQPIMALPQSFQLAFNPSLDKGFWTWLMFTNLWTGQREFLFNLEWCLVVAAG